MNDADTGAGLLRAILASPEEDTARLVYADWLEENGHVQRAEFIRVQIAIARSSPADQCPQCYAIDHGGQRTNGPCRCEPAFRALRRREDDLFKFNTAWSGWWGAPARRDVVRARDLAPERGYLIGSLFVRGFVEQMRCSSVRWLAHADAIVAGHPVTRVALTTAPERSRLRDEYLKMDWMEGAHAVEHRTYEQIFRDLWPRIAFALPT